MASYHLLSIAEGLGIYRITVKPGDGHPAMNGYTYQVIDSDTGKPLQNSMLYRRKDNLEIWHDGEPVLILKGYYSDDISVQYSVDEYSGDFIDYRDPRDLPDMTKEGQSREFAPATDDQAYLPAAKVDQSGYAESTSNFAFQNLACRACPEALQPWVQSLLADEGSSSADTGFAWTAEQSTYQVGGLEFSRLVVADPGYQILVEPDANLWG